MGIKTNLWQRKKQTNKQTNKNRKIIHSSVTCPYLISWTQFYTLTGVTMDVLVSSTTTISLAHTVTLRMAPFLVWRAIILSHITNTLTCSFVKLKKIIRISWLSMNIIINVILFNVRAQNNIFSDSWRSCWLAKQILAWSRLMSDPHMSNPVHNSTNCSGYPSPISLTIYSKSH